MRALRWTLLVLYVLGVLSLVAIGLCERYNRGLTIIAVGVLVVSHTVLLSHVGFKNLCEAAGPRRLVLPVIVTACIMAFLVASLITGLSELFRKPEPSSTTFWIVLGSCWAFWAVVIYLYTLRTTRYKLLKRLVATVFAGSLAQLLIAIPSHIIVSRRPGCLVGLRTGATLAAGVAVLIYALGPGIFLLFIRETHRSEQARRAVRAPSAKESATPG